jgi:hypothetical protein
MILGDRAIEPKPSPKPKPYAFRSLRIREQLIRGLMRWLLEAAKTAHGMNSLGNVFGK